MLLLMNSATIKTPSARRCEEPHALMGSGPCRSRASCYGMSRADTQECSHGASTLSEKGSLFA